MPEARGPTEPLPRHRVQATGISASALRDIVTHAREAWPRECCGLLIGTGKVVQAAHRARNVHDSPTRYLLHPEDHFAAVRLARARALHVVGAYHSHPSGSPAPSATDRAEAEGGGFLYVIAGMQRLRRAARRRRSRHRAPRGPCPPSSVEAQGHWLAAWLLLDGNFVQVPFVRLP